MTSDPDDPGERVASRRSFARLAYAGGALVAMVAVILLILVNLTVGFLGSEDNPANSIFVAVIGVALIGSLTARFRPSGMEKAMAATVAAQLVVGIVALAAGLGSEGWHGVYEVALGTGLFGTLWLLSAWLFRKAAGAQASA